ncbi:S9 family peptidase [Methylorubrum sp. SL192]|uniref:S9 family peptidase n=1 Tax=Methylorubrum sp. SL192 TaxID=2995167 RepID=UPI002273507E|nr:S9 family peptidase [Methylorubrum sp. SL192]MCY1644868.1 S9 family peptidase [Methylorubrum sp. SL192]
MVDLIPRAHLFGNPTRYGHQISPDGRRLGWVAPHEGVLNIWSAPIDDLDAAVPVTTDRRRGIDAYAFAYDGRHLLYVQDADGDENHHLYAVDLTTGERRDLTPIPGIAAAIVGLSRIVRDRVLVAINDRDPRFHDLHSIDLATGERSLVIENPGFAGFLIDERYAVRFAFRNLPDGSSQLIAPDGANWKPWLTFPPEDARVSGAENLDAAGTALFCRDSRGRNTAALTRIDLATGETCVLAAHEEADIGAVLQDAETHEPVAYSVTHARKSWHVLDPRLTDDFAFLETQGLGDWYPASRTEDDALWIVVARADTRVGEAAIYDRQAKTLRSLGSARPELEGAPLAPMSPAVIRSRDGLDLVSYLSRPLDAQALGPLVLLVHGGPWARDSFGFDGLHQWLANRGYAALSVNFRSSTGFGKAFLNAGDREWGRRMDDDLSDAVAWAVEQGVADPARVAIMGGSYGGYATLMALTRNPGSYACGIDLVGPANLETLVRTIPPYWEAMRAQLHRAIGDPDTEEGMALIRERSPVYFADRIKAPLLIVQGANDPRVKQAESDQMVAAMERGGIPVTYLLFPDEGHGLVRPANRLAFFARAEEFLARHLGGRCEPIREDESAGTSMQVVREG